MTLMHSAAASWLPANHWKTAAFQDATAGSATANRGAAAERRRSTSHLAAVKWRGFALMKVKSRHSEVCSVWALSFSPQSWSLFLYFADKYKVEVRGHSDAELISHRNHPYTAAETRRRTSSLLDPISRFLSVHSLSCAQHSSGQKQKRKPGSCGGCVWVKSLFSVMLLWASWVKRLSSQFDHDRWPVYVQELTNWF